MLFCGTARDLLPRIVHPNAGHSDGEILGIHISITATTSYRVCPSEHARLVIPLPFANETKRESQTLLFLVSLSEICFLIALRAAYLVIPQIHHLPPTPAL